MFGRDKPVNSTGQGGITLISKDTKVIGDLYFNGNLEIEGSIRGNIIAEDNSNAAVRILESGHVEGEIKVPAVVINGNVEGDVYASKYVELANKAVVKGNVYYHLIEMVKGAQVNGSLMYQNEAQQPEFLLARDKDRDTDSDEETVVLGGSIVD